MKGDRAKVMRGLRYYHRYADDIVVLHRSKKHLHKLLSFISNYFNMELKIEVKHNYQIFPVSSRGIDYLGYKIYHTHVLLRKSIKQRMFRSFHKMDKSNYKIKMAAYNGWLVHCNSIHLRNKINEMIAKKFSDLGIKVEIDSLLGEKIKIAKVIGKEIIIKDFKVRASKFEKCKDCLTIQIEIGGEDKVIFTGSGVLKKQIEQVKKEDFPFIATILVINETYQFN